MTDDLGGDPIRFVGFLDVLGFSAFVTANSHDTVQNVYNGLIGLAPLGLVGATIKSVEENGERFGTPDLAKVDTNILVISDSIVVFSDRADHQGFLNVLAAVRNLLAVAFYSGLPLRGAVTVGPLSYVPHQVESNATASIQSLFGRGLVDAKNLEAKQDWSGGIVSDEAIEVLKQIVAGPDGPERVQVSDFIPPELMRRWPVPMKVDGRIEPKESWAISWPWGNDDRPPNSMVREAFGMYGKDPTVATEKIEPTIDFLNAVRPDSRRLRDRT
jgi:hypothetical protein